MPPTLTIFIDEAGDPGVRDGVRYAVGRHEWLCLAAIAVRSSREKELGEWVAEMRRQANSTQAGALHYHRVNIARREGVCASLASRPVKAFVLASHKSNLREYVNERIGRMIESGKFYNWCLRLLLERVTAWAADWQRRELGELQPVRIVFARRGGHDYEHFFKYIDLLAIQASAGTLFLRGKGLAPRLLDRSSWEVLPAERWAGLQMADTVASTFYQAANSASPAHDIAPALALRPIIAHEARRSPADYGVTVWPLPHQAELPGSSRSIFEKYGYVFK